jgi:multiple sugar transport system ATP-binding protein
VAGFIGSPMINLIDGRLDGEGGAFAAGATRIPLPGGLRQAAADQGGKPLLLGIRPEDVVVSLEAGSDFVPAKAVVREPLGKEALLLLAVDFLPAGTLLRAITPPDLRPTPEETVWLRFPPERLHLFDGASGVAV